VIEARPRPGMRGVSLETREAKNEKRKESDSVGEELSERSRGENQSVDCVIYLLNTRSTEAVTK